MNLLPGGEVSFKFNRQQFKYAALITFSPMWDKFSGCWSMSMSIMET